MFPKYQCEIQWSCTWRRVEAARNGPLQIQAIGQDSRAMTDWMYRRLPDGLHQRKFTLMKRSRPAAKP